MLFLWDVVVVKAGAPAHPTQTSESWLLEFLQRAGKMGEGEMEDDRGMVMEDECMIHIQNIGGSLVLIFIREGILDCLVAVVVAGVVFFFLADDGGGVIRGGL